MAEIVAYLIYNRICGDTNTGKRYCDYRSGVGIEAAAGRVSEISTDVPTLVACGVPLVVEILVNTGTGGTSPLTPAVMPLANTAVGKAIARTKTKTRHNAKNVFIPSPFIITIFTCCE